jgi:hypothetical protein
MLFARGRGFSSAFHLTLAGGQDLLTDLPSPFSHLNRGPSGRSLAAESRAIGVFPVLGDMRMKKVCVTVVFCLLAVAFCMQTATALPPFQKEWKAKYTPEGSSNTKLVQAAETAKCNVCHMGTSKKDHNPYGQAVKKYLSKAKYNEIKEDADAAKKYIDEGLTKAEGEKNAAGKTYGDVLKAGGIPWE